MTSAHCAPDSPICVRVLRPTVTERLLAKFATISGQRKSLQWKLMLTTEKATNAARALGK